MSQWEYDAAKLQVKLTGYYGSGSPGSQSSPTEHRTEFPREQPPDLETSRAAVAAFIAEYKSQKQNGNRIPAKG